MPGRYQLSDIQPEPPPRKGVGAYSLAEIDAPATAKPPQSATNPNNVPFDPDATQGSMVARAFKAGAAALNPAPLVEAIMSPVETGKRIMANSERKDADAQAAGKRGEYGRALLDSVEAVPVVGGMIEGAEHRIRNLQIPELVGELMAGRATPGIVKGGAKVVANMRPAPGVPSAVGRGIVEGAKESALPILKDFELNRPVRSGVEALERTFGKIREELAKNKTTQAVEANRQANPGRAVEPVAGEPLTDATPIMPWAHQNMASQYGTLPSGRKVGPAFQQPMTKASRAAAARVDVPSEALPDATPIVGDLPSGRRPMTAMEREAKYAKPLPKPDNAARVSTKSEPGSPMERLSPEKLAEHQALAAEYAEPATLGQEYPARDWLAGKSAEKAMNFAHEFERVGIPSEHLELMTEKQWGEVTEHLNKLRDQEWQAAGNKGKPPNAHTNPKENTRAQIISLLKDSEARKAATQ